MQQLLEQRYTGCSTSASGTAGYGWMDPGMMGGHYGNGGQGPMISPGGGAG